MTNNIEENSLLEIRICELEEELKTLSWRKPIEVFHTDITSKLPIPRFELICWAPKDWTEYKCGLYFIYQHMSNMTVFRVPLRETDITGPDPDQEPIWFNPEQFDPIHAMQILHLKKSSGLPCYVRIGKEQDIKIKDIEITSELAEELIIELGRLQTTEEMPIAINQKYTAYKKAMISSIRNSIVE